MSFIRQIAVPVLLTVFGTVSFLGTGLHLLPGCGHFHAPWQHCALHAHSGGQHPQVTDENGLEKSHDDCEICRFVALPRILTPPPKPIAGGTHFERLLLAATLQYAGETQRAYAARGPPGDSATA